ncbi:hypothetical protein [uncultured Haemophilus sp.]|jgi:hypothetical protein|uniref:hypothetical protein n=1 Tax=uncultured Haemophilus sp. TaxID=237779 RepID=UPI002070D3C6|nr:hypothetical protein [uncultured Haemophilus sp.]DAS01750.1 MAG TPA: hypothetical protein [Caudoviricetes sp.]
MDKTKLYAVISTMAIYHNNQRYEQSDKLKLTDEEAERIALYVQLVEPEQVEPKQVQSGSAATEADVQVAEANIAQAEDKTKGKKGE